MKLPVARHVIALAAVSLVVLTAAIASPGHAIVLSFGLAAGPWLSRYLWRTPEPLPAAVETPKQDVGIALGSVLDAMPQPVLLVDARCRLTLANAAGYAAYPALAPGEPLAFALRTPELLDAVAATLADAVPRSVEIIERVPLERAFTAVVAALAARGPGAAAAAILLRETSKERAVEAMRADFVANASHELRTPLTSILGFVETLRGAARDDPAAREKFLGIIHTQARRMARLIDDLLSLSRIELKEHIAPTEPVALGAIVNDVALALSEVARERHVEIVVAAQPGPIIVLGDHDELASMVENLVENAIKYGHAGKRAEITLRDAPPDHVRLVVRDFGPGIPAHALPRLTERFYRVDNALSRAEGGTGLGLALVKHTVNRHRGRLEIDSVPGQGTSVTITLRRGLAPAVIKS